MNLIIKPQMENVFDGDCAVEEQPHLSKQTGRTNLGSVLEIAPVDKDKGSFGALDPNVEFGKPLQDWFEMALNSETPIKVPLRASWGDDEDEVEEEPLKEDTEDEESDPFEDFDEDDFDDDFDDDFEEEHDDEYEIEPADDGLVNDPDADLANGNVLEEDEEIGPEVDDID
ncbi:MAG TPA: hypothetical protein VM260_03130 [Pirellula sp.]|nr:hypothetical protein [Pirellula sp.]